MYSVNPHHRNGNVNKSQWTISEADEIRSFELASANGWLLAEKGWSLHFVDLTATWLGVAKDRTTQLFVAKFVGGQEIDWHGYPADYRNNNHDIPEEAILRSWLTQKHLSAAKVRKIAKGQPCSL